MAKLGIRRYIHHRNTRYMEYIYIYNWILRTPMTELKVWWVTTVLMYITPSLQPVTACCSLGNLCMVYCRFAGLSTHGRGGTQYTINRAITTLNHVCDSIYTGTHMNAYTHTKRTAAWTATPVAIASSKRLLHCTVAYAKVQQITKVTAALCIQVLYT